MKTKICSLCNKEETTLYRVQIKKGSFGFSSVPLVAIALRRLPITAMEALGKGIGIKYKFRKVTNKKSRRMLKK